MKLVIVRWRENNNSGIGFTPRELLMVYVVTVDSGGHYAPAD